MIIADVNEFHPLTDGVAYREATEPDGSDHPIVIMRATYSNTHVDNAYASSLTQARKAGLLVGHYGYMVAGLDPAIQGAYFGTVVKAHGGLKAGDTIWCDDEEGQGNQEPRSIEFLNAAHAVLHDNPVDEGVYSGAAFWTAHQLGSLPTGVLRWIAAYGQADPKVAGEDLWQFTDSRVMAGVSGPCDASIYNGTVADLMKLAAASGPFRHEIPAGNTRTIDGLAGARHTNIAFLTSFSLEHVNANHAAIINSYMALRSALIKTGAPSPVLPAGFVWWSVNP